MQNNEVQKNEVFVIESDILNQYKNIKHGYFTRVGGVSEGEFSSLNSAESSNDSKENITKNLQIIEDYLRGANPQFLGKSKVTQKHTNKAIVVDRKNYSLVGDLTADALITKEKNIALTIKTADCLPIVCYCPQKEVIAAIHAGWAGLALGVISSAIKQMAQEFAVNISTLQVAILPSISQQSYQVGKDVVQAISQKHNQQNISQMFLEKPQEKWLFSPAKAAELEFFSLGIVNIETISYNTFTEIEHCFSYRRSSIIDGIKDPAGSGRNLSFIMMK